MSTRKTILSVLLTGAIVLQMSVSVYAITINGVTYTLNPDGSANTAGLGKAPSGQSSYQPVGIPTIACNIDPNFIAHYDGNRARDPAGLIVQYVRFAAVPSSNSSYAELQDGLKDIRNTYCALTGVEISTVPEVVAKLGSSSSNSQQSQQSQPSSQYYTVVGINGSTYSCSIGVGNLPPRVWTPETVITSYSAYYCTVIGTGGAVGGQQTQQLQQQTQPLPQTLGDVDPNAASGSCVELTSTTLRYQAKDSDNAGEVTTLQVFLNDNNYLPTAPTGFFGAGTLRAVKAFQKANNLNPTGYVGVNTRTAIKTVSCNSVGSGSATLNDNNTPVTSSLPAGCDSASGFSRTTGVKCTP